MTYSSTIPLINVERMTDLENYHLGTIVVLIALTDSGRGHQWVLTLVVKV